MNRRSPSHTAFRIAQDELAIDEVHARSWVRDPADTGNIARDLREQTAIAILIATVTIAVAPLLSTLSPIVAVVVLSVVGVALAIQLPAQAPFLAIFWLLFQNIFVSVFSPYVSAPSDLEIIKGYNFLLCAVMWLVSNISYFLHFRTSPPDIRKLMIAGWAILSIILLFFALGFPSTGTAAVIYLRNIAFPFFLFQMALLTSANHDVRLRPTLVVIAAIFICCGYIEFFFRDFWLHMTNGEAYWRFEEIKATDTGTWEKEMRISGRVHVTLKDRFTINFFNTPLLQGMGFPDLLRLFGTNIHAISFAYALIFFILVFTSIGLPWLAVATLPLAILSGVKGALILLVFVAGSWLLTWLIGARRTLVLGLLALCIYVAFGIRLGLLIGDYHVIGFMGGWNGLLHAPLGRGLGFGGNLTQDFSAIDWSTAQQAGAVDGAFESAIGVLLYQMGVAALAPLGFIAFIGYRTWALHARSGDLLQGAAGFGIFAILANGIFQEEALFSPLALGLLMSLAGLVLGSDARRNRNAV